MTSILKKKLNKKGFTLAELLVVVAIIAVLVAIAIPVFSGALSKADKAVVDANLRSARAEATVDYLLNSRTGDQKYTFTVTTDGKITLTAPAPAESSDTESCNKQADGTYKGTVIVKKNSYGS